MVAKKGSRKARGLLPPGFRVITGFKDGDEKVYKLNRYKDRLPSKSELQKYDDIVVWGRGRLHQVDMKALDQDNLRWAFYDHLAEVANGDWSSPK